MTAEHVLVASAAVALPALAGGLLLAFPHAVRWSRAIGVVGSLGAVVLLAWLLADGVAGVAVAWEWAPALSVRVAWRLDVATLSIAMLVAGVGALVLHVAGTYFGASQKGRRAIGLLCIFQSSMLGLVLADELLLLFTFWELTGLCSFFLINTDADKRDDTFASAQQALVITVGGALPMLVGFLYLIFETGTGSLSALATRRPLTGRSDAGPGVDPAWRPHQERAGSLPLLVARCDGGAHPDLGVPALGHDGEGRSDPPPLPVPDLWRLRALERSAGPSLARQPASGAATRRSARTT